jgi:DsbC/DsbD-like thiol-disulfide interchange protein
MRRAVILLATPLLLGAAGATKTTVVKWSATGVSSSGARGAAHSVIHVRASVASGWHVYALTQKHGGPKPLAFAIEGASGFALGHATGPAPQRAYDAEFGLETETYSGAPEFTIPVVRKAGSASGSQNLRLVIRYQACSANLCLPPLKEIITVSLNRAAAG